MSFSIDPQQKRIKIRTIKRSSILPIQLTMKTQQTRSMMMKTETIDLFSFLSKYAKRNFSLRHPSKKKQSCWYYTDKTHTVKYVSKKILCHCFRSIRIVQPCNTKQKISRRPRTSTQKNNERHFFSVSNDRVFDLPFKFSSSFPHRLCFAILNQNR